MNSLDKLVSSLSKLPGVGRRSAERMAVKIVRDTGTVAGDLVAALQDANNNICCCSSCGSITQIADDPCRLCTEQGRDDTVLCVVEDPDDIASIERSGGFQGRYHALMGRISPMKGDGPSDLRIKDLIKRVDDGGFQEVILALSTDMEGDSTAAFITEYLKSKPVKITRLAFGLPAGSGITYSDPVTLAKAIKGRQDT